MGKYFNPNYAEDLLSQLSEYTDLDKKEVINGNIIDKLMVGAKLEDVQKSDLLNIFLKRKALLTSEMGIGKTFTSLGLIQLYRCLYPDKKVMLVAPNNRMKDFEEHITNKLKARVISTTGAEQQVKRFLKKYKNHDVILAQSSAWERSTAFSLFIYNHVEDFSIAIYDEGNGKKANGFRAFCQFCNRLPNACIINATPEWGDSEQIFNLYKALIETEKDQYKKETLENFTKTYYSYDKNSGKYEPDTYILGRVFDNCIVNTNRTDLGIDVNVDLRFIYAEETAAQKTLLKTEANRQKIFYSVASITEEESRIRYNNMRETVGAMDKLIEIIMANRDESIIVYMRYSKIIEDVYNYLTAIGIKTFIIDGKTTPKAEDKFKVEQEFNSTPNSVILTSIEIGSNLGSADRVILYSTPSNFSQTIYRSVRSRESTSIKVDWILYPVLAMEYIGSTLETLKDTKDAQKRDIGLIKILETELFKLSKGSGYMERFK